MSFKWKGYFPDKEDEFYKYIEENGVFWDSKCWSDVYGHKGRNWAWVRSHRIPVEYNYVTSKQIADELYKKALADAFGQKMDPNKPVALSIDSYNDLVKCDAWEGGYVERLGYVEVAASSLYGNSIYLNSWVACGEQNNPVSLKRFYELSRKGQWRGGYVNKWGYVSHTQHIPGSSLDFESVERGEETVGSVVNALNMIAHGGSADSMKERLSQYYDTVRNEYVVENNDLFKVLHNYFIVTKLHNYDDVNTALSKHKAVLLRVVDRTESSIGETRKYGKDYLILSSSITKSEYVILDSVGCAISTISYKNLNDENCLIISLEEQ